MKATARIVVAAAALALVATACTWGQFGAGPARTSSNPLDGGITTANASTVGVLSQTSNSLAGEPALTTGSAFTVAGGALYSYPLDPSTCTGSPPSCTPNWFAHIVGNLSSSPVVDNDRVFTAWAGTNGHWQLAAYDALGRGNCTALQGCPPLWTASFGTAPAPIATVPVVTVGAGRVYVLTGGQQQTDPATITAFDEAGVVGCSGTPMTCQPEFRTSSNLSSRGWPAVSGGRLYADAVDDSAVLVFDAAGSAGCTAGVCAAQFALTTGSRASVSVSGTTAFAAVGPQLRAYDATGATNCAGSPKVCSPVWTGALPAGASTSDPPTVAGGHVFVAESGNPGSVLVFDAAGANGCTGSPKTCQSLWTFAGGGGNASIHVSAAQNVLVTSWFDLTPGFGPAAGIDVFDLAGSAGCSGSPKVCLPLRTVSLGSLESISSPALASGHIAVIAGFSGRLVVLGATG